MKAARLIAAMALAGSSLAMTQSLPDPRIAGAVLLLSQEPPAKIMVDPPLAAPLSRGEAVIGYRTQNIRLLPQFGPAAAAVSPRIGHLHLSLDDAPWVWVNASGEPVMLSGLRPGPHKLRLQLETANHQQLDEGSVSFTVPPRSANAPAAARARAGWTLFARAPKLVIDAPKAEPLARGVLFVEVRAPDPGILQRILHLHVSLDGPAGIGKTRVAGRSSSKALHPGDMVLRSRW